MKKNISRREFFRKSSALGFGSVFLLRKNIRTHQKTELGIVKGTDYFENTKRAVQLIGGIRQYIPAKAKVALLPNPQSNNPGTYTKPGIVKAVIQLCKEAGAAEIACIGWLPIRNWVNTGLKKVIDSEDVNLLITDYNDESLFKKVPVKNGVLLKEARLMKTYLNYDVLVNIPIVKEHSGNCFSGPLKNMMGINSPKSDRSFHKRDNQTNSDDIRYLEQCIADLNTVIKPQLCITDATEFVLTNGPYGPGKLAQPNKIIAGRDPVAIEAYCTRFFALKPENVIAIKSAFTHGIGEMDLKKVKIREIEV